MWISAVINPYGTPARVVEAVLDGQVVAVVSQQLLDELAAVLIRPKFRHWVNVAFVEALAGYAELHPDPGLPASGFATRTTTTSSPSPTALTRSSSPGTPTSSTPSSPQAITPHALLDQLA